MYFSKSSMAFSKSSIRFSHEAKNNSHETRAENRSGVSLFTRFRGTQLKSATPYPCIITTARIGKIVIKNPRASVPERYLHIRNASQDLGIPFFHHHSESPFRVFEVHDLVTRLEIETSHLFLHDDIPVTSCTSRRLPEKDFPEVPLTCLFSHHPN